ncbi:MAG: hypothetical protein A2139_01700 [Desulfobacca sp. RBG_16_60_12]|nr:MAG: hypothetical protein A2139_01700 [Desulfobacca sp. RBG_16_60_12]
MFCHPFLFRVKRLFFLKLKLMAQWAKSSSMVPEPRISGYRTETRGRAGMAAAAPYNPLRNNGAGQSPAAPL